ncbi:hypothetical protein [Azotobacter beijerinckii]|uniref:hypothetical protein n=1 Tax=Azotobacter beijerinckii TaxID=170623 RepID=UPI000B8224C7|nr:hypothetical protein [Azotobacter beijerinckii]
MIYKDKTIDRQKKPPHLPGLSICRDCIRLHALREKHQTDTVEDAGNTHQTGVRRIDDGSLA